MTKKKKYLLIGIAVIAGCLLIKYFTVVITFLCSLLKVLEPILFGCIIAYILNLPMRFYERHFFPNNKNKVVSLIRRPVCMLLALLSLLAILTAVLLLVIPELISAFTLIGKEIQPAAMDAYNWIMNKSKEMPALQELLKNLNLDIPSIFNQVMNTVFSGTGNIFNSVVSVITVVFGSLVNFFIGLIFAFYLLLSKSKLRGQFGRLFRVFVKTDKEEKLHHIIRTADRTFSSFIVGQCTEAVILGVLCAIGMAIFRFPYAIMTGAVVGVTALIPIVGAYIGAVIGAFMIFTVNPIQALWFVVFLVILQQFEGNVIYPKVVGNSIGLPGMWVLAAITIGGGLWGIPGMLLGVPLAATIYKLLREHVEEKEEEERQKKALEEGPEQLTFEE